MRLLISLALALSLALLAAHADTRVVHGSSLVGALKSPPDFKHFDYVNPDAPKGGEVRLGAFGTQITQRHRRLQRQGCSTA